MVKLISDNYCVDMSNLISTGFSWGGGMTYELACARANAADDNVGYAFRAGVIYEGAQLSGCDNGKDPIALWQMVGLTDTTCPVSLATPIRDQFVKNNGCTGWTSETGDTATPSTSGSTAQEPPRPKNAPPDLNPGGHVCTNYTGCSAGHPLRWCVHQSAHTPAPVDGNYTDLYQSCGAKCSASCPCTWMFDDVWTWLNSPGSNAHTPNAIAEPAPPN
jgi:hypothetical protein